MVISFSSEKPRGRLLQGQRVFTARTKRRKQFIKAPWGKGLHEWANEGRTKPKICDITIWEIGYFTAKALKHFVMLSGFDSLDEWIEEIKRLNNWKDVLPTDEFWLYLVQERDSFFKPEIPS